MTVNFLELVKDTNPLIQGTQMILKRIKTFTPTHVIMKLQSTKDGENLKAQGKGGHFFFNRLSVNLSTPTMEVRDSEIIFSSAH